MTNKQNKSLHLTSGLILGTAVAAGATFLYKTKPGQKLRKEFASHLEPAKDYLADLIEDIKQKTQQLEADLEKSQKKVSSKTKRQRSKTRRQIKKTADNIKKKVFLKGGKPLVN